MFHLIFVLFLNFINDSHSLTPGIRLTGKFINRMNELFFFIEHYFTTIVLTLITIIVSSYMFYKDENKLLCDASSTIGKVNKMEEMIKNGANINFKGRNGRTPLVEAARSNNIDGLQLLITNGALINVQDSRRGTALIAASHAGHEQIVQMLLDSKIDIDAKRESDQITALQIACSAGHLNIVKL